MAQVDARTAPGACAAGFERALPGYGLDRPKAVELFVKQLLRHLFQGLFKPPIASTSTPRLFDNRSFFEQFRTLPRIAIRNRSTRGASHFRN